MNSDASRRKNCELEGEDLQEDVNNWRHKAADREENKDPNRRGKEEY